MSRDPAKYTDGGPKAHIVAYAVLKKEAHGVMPHTFERRYWWVKTYDRFVGHGLDRGYYYSQGGPCEAVLVDSIQANRPTTSGARLTPGR